MSRSPSPKNVALSDQIVAALHTRGLLDTYEVAKEVFPGRAYHASVGQEGPAWWFRDREVYRQLRRLEQNGVVSGIRTGNARRVAWMLGGGNREANGGGR
ncbi:MAG: hypothetical protein M3O70_08785 [Actinomycetota bacterium]|nr:hypothetical protein [Actinomycetota bacterium]